MIVAKTTYQTVPAWTSCANLSALLMSLVIIPAAKPYVVLLALSIASSIVENLISCWTGPKI